MADYFKNSRGEDYEKLSSFLDQYWFNAPLIRTAENQVKGGGRTYFLTKYYVS